MSKPRWSRAATPTGGGGGGDADAESGGTVLMIAARAAEQGGGAGAGAGPASEMTGAGRAAYDTEAGGEEMLYRCPVFWADAVRAVTNRAERGRG